ncbi:hypothetical protein BH09PAT4_BH09PAT4_07370 [soil metagenome]
MLHTFGIEAHLTGFAALLALALVLCIILALIFVAVSPGLILSAALRKKAEQFYQAREHTVIAQYDPPFGLSPAQLGLLYDMKCEDKEIRATLFVLQKRGVISIDSMEAVTVLDQNAFQNLEDYEKIAIRMFDKNTAGFDAARSMPITMLDNDGSAQTVTIPLPRARSRYEFTEAVQKSLRAKGYHMKNYTFSFTLRVLAVAFLVSLWPMASAAIPLDSNGITYPGWSIQSFGSATLFTMVIGIIAFPLYLLFGYLFMRLYVRIAGRAWLNTKQIRQLWPELEGYRLFLQQVELDNIQFESTQHGPVSSALPYAMVFNLDTKWQQRLK